MTRDTDTVKMSHEEMIDTLKGLVFGTFDRTTAKEREALDMAIKALQTDPSAGVIPIPEEATNGDMIKAMILDFIGDNRPTEIQTDFEKGCAYICDEIEKLLK